MNIMVVYGCDVDTVMVYRSRASYICTGSLRVDRNETEEDKDCVQLDKELQLCSLVMEF